MLSTLCPLLSVVCFLLAQLNYKVLFNRGRLLSGYCPMLFTINQ